MDPVTKVPSPPPLPTARGHVACPPHPSSYGATWQVLNAFEACETVEQQEEVLALHLLHKPAAASSQVGHPAREVADIFSHLMSTLPAEENTSNPDEVKQIRMEPPSLLTSPW